MKPYAVHIGQSFYANAVLKGIYLVLVHVQRMPPHIGLMIDGRYHSLAIKGQEINVAGNALLKNIGLRKIPALFIKIKKHPVFSNDHLNECFIDQVRQFDKVNAEGNTCLAPVKFFFEEFYAIDKKDVRLIFDLLDRLRENDFIEAVSGMNLGELSKNIFYLQPYNEDDLQRQIASELSKLGT